MKIKSSYLCITEAELATKIERSYEIIKKCTLCPRNCGIDRTSGEMGFCRTGDMPFVSSWNAHYGEEAPLTGSHGSGTIFFTNCNLGCIFCQNYTISHLGEGGEMSFEALANIMLKLQGQGCHNINLVTPTHQVPMILKSLKIAREKGLNIPLVYNCGGYESINTLKILDSVIDIYMPDFKFADKEIASKYADAEDYPEIVRSAIKEMHRQVGDLVLDSRGIAIRGLLVRHLVLPDGLAGTEEICRFIAGEISDNTYINIMAQYYPCYKAKENPPLDRRLTADEYSEAIRIALKAGLKRLD